ncbi:hypothetical protein DE146DRAFT_614392 [Phaeosphaeria sp. MPI-PUGE-AT-0046c]|nr:hypothetical protein DE146DRAFT_614392 [Phaeosphaeria sp. MPI-PUGE-AT-0046c]
MPYESWHSLHHHPSSSLKNRFRCPVCYQERIATAHARKGFLVAERLAWNDTIVSNHDRGLNEELNRAVNYELGILEPCVANGKNIPGGEKSQGNRFYPYINEHEMRLALKLVFMTDELTHAIWAMWIGAQMSFQELLEGSDLVQNAAESDSVREKNEEGSYMASVQVGSLDLVETIDLTELLEPGPTYRSSVALPSAIQANSALARAKLTAGSFPDREPCKRIQSYKTLHDFYSLLDKIERTSYVGALFLEAYAEKLCDDMCKSRWFRHNVLSDLS